MHYQVSEELIGAAKEDYEYSFKAVQGHSDDVKKPLN